MSAPTAWLASAAEEYEAMLPPVTIVVLSKYADTLGSFVQSADQFTNGIPKMIVRDPAGDILPFCIPKLSSYWLMTKGPDQFSMAGNANHGWKAAEPHDVLYIGDDCRFVEPQTVERLRSLAYSDPAIGIVYPALRGISSEEQSESYCRGIAEDLIYLKRGLPYVCIYLKREVIEKVGYLDEETFTGYGYEDDDYNHRVQLAGFKLALAPHVIVEHASAQTTFKRNHGGNVKPVFAEMEVNRARYLQKWGRLP